MNDFLQRKVSFAFTNNVHISNNTVIHSLVFTWNYLPKYRYSFCRFRFKFSRFTLLSLTCQIWLTGKFVRYSLVVNSPNNFILKCHHCSDHNLPETCFLYYLWSAMTPLVRPPYIIILLISWIIQFVIFNIFIQIPLVYVINYGREKVMM